MSFKKIPFWVKKRRPLPGKLDKSRKVVVEKFTRQRSAARRANATTALDPGQIDIARVRYHMQLAELEAMKARVPRPNFSFSPQDVTAIHTQKDGEAGIWFRLNNGRVFSSTGEPDSTNPDAYDD
jgi:hypothetical protein